MVRIVRRAKGGHVWEGSCVVCWCGFNYGTVERREEVHISYLFTSFWREQEVAVWVWRVPARVKCCYSGDNTENVSDYIMLPQLKLEAHKVVYHTIYLLRDCWPMNEHQHQLCVCKLRMFCLCFWNYLQTVKASMCRIWDFQIMHPICCMSYYSLFSYVFFLCWEICTITLT